MKKVLIIFFSFISFLCVFAQEKRISTTYEYPNDEYVLYLNRFLNVDMIKTIITGESLKDKEYDVELIVCRNGDFERKNLTDNINFAAASDTISIYFIAQPLSPDKVKMEFYGPFGHKEEIEIATTHSMLIEPVNSTGFGYDENIPIMTYSPGIIQKIEVNRKVYEGIDVCGVRYSEIPPAEWYNKLGIQNYFYLELVPKPAK